MRHQKGIFKRDRVFTAEEIDMISELPQTTNLGTWKKGCSKKSLGFPATSRKWLDRE